MYRSAKYKELEGLVGSKKGDTIKGLNEVKKILHRKGYMDAYNPAEDDNDRFDEKLHAAINAYHYYHSGRFNGTSLEMIDCKFLGSLTYDLGRCGLEDGMNATDKEFKTGYYADEKKKLLPPYRDFESEEEEFIYNLRRIESEES